MRDPEIEFRPAPSIRDRIRMAQSARVVTRELEFCAKASFMSESTRRRIKSLAAWKLKDLERSKGKENS